MSKHRCIHPDCEYRHRDESKGGHEYVPNGCDYASITGKSRIAQLPPEMWDPALCPLYKPRAEGEERKKAPILLIPQRPKGPREWEEKARALWAAGKMDTEIAAALNISPPTVRLFREKNNLPRNVYHRERFRFDKKLALELYKAGRSDAEIANKVGCSRGTIGEWRKAEGLPANVNRPVPQSHMDWDKARRLYDQGKSDSEIAQALGCCKQYVAKWRRKNGLETRTAVQTFDWQLARELYEQGKTDREIAQALGCVYQAVSKWRKKNDLPSKFLLKREERKHERARKG